MLLISPNFDVKSINLSQFWPGAFFPKLLKKALLLSLGLLKKKMHMKVLSAMVMLYLVANIAD